ncbi:MAG: CHASE2 domain-containing protein [Bacteroidia bacterium]|nr:CHASE2 domain-containing protein [Bacteroidia bacterium]
MKFSILIRFGISLLLTVGGALALDALIPLHKWGWDIRDLIYRRLPPQSPDTQIVIVDIAKLNRAALAQLLKRLAMADPLIIAIDAVFPTPLSGEEDSLWQKALCEVSVNVPVCLAATLDLRKPIEEAPVQSVSMTAFTQCVEQAYANMITYEPYAPKTVREFIPYTVSDSDTHYSLGLRVALALDPSLLGELPNLIGKVPIRYLGNLEHFYYLSGEEVLRDTNLPNWLQNKALFLGLVDPLKLTLEDIFFTPLNAAFLRQDFPDMYGVVIHANITSMLRHRRFYEIIPKIWAVLLLGLFHLFLFFLCGYLEGAWRWVSIRLSQILAFIGTVELTIELGVRGFWFPIESLLWGIVIAGELLIWQRRWMKLA